MASCPGNDFMDKFGFIFPLGFFTIFFSAFYFSTKKTRESLKRLSGYLTGYVTKNVFWPTFSGEYQGLKFLIRLTPRNKNSPPQLVISLFKKSSFRLYIYRESISSNFWKKLGLLKEVNVNDESFDRDFLLISNRPDQAKAYLSNSNAKGVVREMFNIGFNMLFIEGDKLSAFKPNYNLETDIQPQNIMALLQKISRLAGGLL